MSDWVGAITQVVVAAVDPNFSSRTGRLEAVEMMETTRRLGEQEFQGTTDPTEAEEWLKNLERTFGVMD